MRAIGDNLSASSLKQSEAACGRKIGSHQPWTTPTCIGRRARPSSTSVHSASPASEPACSKVQPTTQLLVPGLMVIWCTCCAKGSALRPARLRGSAHHLRPALHLLHHRSSPLPFDNGCTVHRYALYREPTFFKHTWFPIDKLHFAGHTNRSTTYSYRGACWTKA